MEPPPACDPPSAAARSSGRPGRSGRSCRPRRVRHRRRSLGFLVGGLLLGAVVAGLAVLAPADVHAAGPAEVDAELVLAVDVSFSMDPQEQRLQREGYVAALRSGEVRAAIGQGLIGRIAVLYMEWAGADDQTVVVDWQVLSDPASIDAFADSIAAAPLSRVYRTSISAALSRASHLLESNDIRGLRRVIDMSGDGPNNQGGPVEDARDRVLAAGITINGLPLMLTRPFSSPFDMADLDAYYSRCVIGGPGAFVVPVRDTADFPDAIRRKMVMEIAGRMPAGPLPVQKASVSRDEFCTIGERQWRQRFFDDN